MKGDRIFWAFVTVIVWALVILGCIISTYGYVKGGHEAVTLNLIPNAYEVQHGQRVYHF